jgi:ribosomal protein S14
MAQFWGVQCKSCGRFFGIIEKTEPDVKQPPWDNPSHQQQQRCPVCGKWNVYSPDDMDKAGLIIGPDPEY